MRDPRLIRDLIREELSLASVMLKYDVIFQFNPIGVSEVQLKCPFHGEDHKPSARLYNNTKSMYCWVCKKTWDVVGFIAEKQGMGYWEAVKWIVKYYHIDISGIPDSPELNASKPAPSEDITEFLHVRSSILDFRNKLELEKYKILCFAYYSLLHKFNCGLDVSEGLSRLLNKIMEIREREKNNG